MAITDTDLDDPNRAQFSVYVFWQDGEWTSQDDWRWLKMGPATQLAVQLTRRPINRTRLVSSIIITDGGDFTIWEWKPGQGITFPPELKGKLK